MILRGTGMESQLEMSKMAGRGNMHRIIFMKIFGRGNPLFVIVLLTTTPFILSLVVCRDTNLFFFFFLYRNKFLSSHRKEKGYKRRAISDSVSPSSSGFTWNFTFR